MIDSFKTLMAAVSRGLPLPVASIRNRRAFVFIENLLDAIEALLPVEVPGGVYLLRDDEEVSTPELLTRIARHLDTAPRMLRFPPGLLRLGLKAIGRGGMAAALIGSLSIDDSATRTRLNWKPRISFDDGLAATCRDFLKAAP